MALTLGELLDLPGFGLELLIGEERDRGRHVEGVHCIEHLDPVPWLQEGWVMMTTGAQLRDGERSQRLLVERLSDGGMTALGVGLGAYIDDIPSALVDEAARRGFPVFTTPYETSFREIVTYVNQSLLSHDLYVLRRLTWMQQYLLEALHEPDAEQTLIDRLSSLMSNAGAAYVGLDGRAVAAAGATIAWDALASHCDTRGTRETELDGRWAIVAPVLDGGAPGGWLTAVARSRPLDRQLTKLLLETAASLLGLLLTMRRTAVVSRLDSRQRVALRALRLARGEQDPGLASALAREGLDFTEPCRAALGALRGRGDDSGRAALDAFDAFAHELALDAVSTACDGRAVMLAQGPLDGWGDWLAQADASLAVGVSEPFGRIDEIGPALDQAQLALVAALTLPGDDGPIRRHEDLDPEVLLVGSVRSRAVHARLDSILEPLCEDPRLLEAVEAYFAAGFDVGQAAAALHLHRNSLRNRLLRAEEHLGRPLKSSATIASLHLALIARHLDGRGISSLSTAGNGSDGSARSDDDRSRS